MLSRCSHWLLRSKRETDVTTIANDTPTDEVTAVAADDAAGETVETAAEAAEVSADAVSDVEAEFSDIDGEVVDVVEDIEDATEPVTDVEPVADVEAEAEVAASVVPDDLFAAATVPTAVDAALVDAAPVDAEATVALPTAAAPATQASPVDIATAEAVAAAPERKRGKKGLIWGIAGGAAVLVGAATVAGFTLVAPNTTVAGVPVGLKMPGQAASAVEEQINNVMLTVQGPSGSFQVSGAELGATFDARALADEVHNGSPLWNIGAWSGKNYTVPVTVDPAKLEAAAVAAQPESFTAATDAAVTYNAQTGQYIVTESATGTGIDAAAAAQAVSAALTNGETDAQFVATAVTIDPLITDEVATQTATKLNAAVKDAGFYVGDEKVMPVEAKTISSMITVEPNTAGTGFQIVADTAALKPIIDGIPAKVNRPAQDGFQIVDSAGDSLQVEREALDGREVGDISKLDESFAAALEGIGDSGAAGPLKVTVPAKVTPAKMVNELRQIHVDLSQQRLYQMVNGEVYDSWPISSGTSATPTHTGNYRIEWKLESQTMSGAEVDAYGNPLYEPEKLPDGSPNPKAGQPITYKVENVQYPMYHNTAMSEAFHGVYWHDNFGYPMSHGCIGMPNWRAESLWHWTPYGTEVSIYYS